MARRFATRIGAISANRFAENKKKPIFITCERFARIVSNPLRFALLSPPKVRFAKKGVQFGNPEATRENQAI